MGVGGFGNVEVLTLPASTGGLNQVVRKGGFPLPSGGGVGGVGVVVFLVFFHAGGAWPGRRVPAFA